MWMGYWGKHMKAESFKLVKEYQKVRTFIVHIMYV